MLISKIIILGIIPVASLHEMKMQNMYLDQNKFEDGWAVQIFIKS